MGGDGSKQHMHPGYQIQDAASLTVLTDVVLITTAIEAHERKYLEKMPLWASLGFSCTQTTRTGILYVAK